MASLEKKVKRLQWSSSKARLFFAVFLMIAVFCEAVFIRYSAIEPILLKDTSMQPRHTEGSLIWMCKLAQCTQSIAYNQSVWAKLNDQETIVRKVIALPGDTLEISDKGRVKSSHKRFMWKNEDSFIESRKFYIPKKGDVLQFSELNDIEEDHVLRIMFEQKVPFFIKTTLWQGNREINIERIGSTKLGNRLVSLQELDLLPWQDRRLIEQQIRQAEPGNATIKIKREFFSTVDSTKLESYEVQSDNYFLACEKGKQCVDSREIGLFPKERILGTYIKEPDIAKKFVLKYYNIVEKHVVAVAKQFLLFSISKVKKNTDNKAQEIEVQENVDTQDSIAEPSQP